MIDLDVSELALYFGDDYVINEYITITQPTIGEIVKYGEAQYFSMLHTITAIPSDLKSQLWDMGLDWCEVADFDLFMILSQTLTPDRTSILFGDLDFSKLRPFKNNQNDEIVLADKERGLIIDKLIYTRITNYLCKLHGITPRPEKAKGKRAKQAMIDEDRRNRELNKDKPFKSFLMPLISSLKVKQGYTKDYVRNMGLFEFFSDISRIQAIDSADHLLNGMYCGMADLSKIDKKNFNWMREL
jgi:hypothetical protein